jgi:hypothetical protein
MAVQGGGCRAEYTRHMVEGTGQGKRVRGTKRRVDVTTRRVGFTERR